MKTFRNILDLLTHHEKRQGLRVLLMVIGMALLESIGVVSVMPFLAVLGNPEMININPVLSELFDMSKSFGVNSADQFLMALGVGAFLIIITSSIYRAFTHFYLNRFIEMRRDSIGSRLLETYLYQPYSFFLGRHSGEMSKTVLSEVDQFVHQTLRPVIMMLAYSVVLVSLIALLVIADPKLAIIVAATFGLLYFFVYLAIRGYLERTGKLRVESNSERFLMAAEAFGGIKSIKLRGCEPFYMDRFSSASRQFARIYAGHQTLTQAPKFLIEAIAFGGVILLTLALLHQQGGGQGGALGQVLPLLGLYAFAAYRIQPATTAIYLGMANLRYGALTVENLRRDLSIGVPDSHQQNVTGFDHAREYIELDNVDFSYPETTKMTLSGINLKIPVGSSIGIVGSTGSGKTTLVDIILGLLRPSEGAILVDGKLVTENNLRDWQRTLGYVPQEIFLTDTSIAQNIAYGLSREEIDMAQVERCARMAQVHDFISQELPGGYESLVGERGVRLSGGQRQRIGIARALYHDPSVMVFDEATSALDTVTEQAVMQAIEKFQNNKTIIIIAHRLSTVSNCDNVVILAGGHVKAQGSFNELSESDPQFKAMV
ncbi:ABC transporter ATP-binding protein [Neptunomonas antarctica]|uniref:ABC-type bacteriocin/lantibiotic exporter, contains an N-terminal double-glycine peptidase domain n=1 Tax=Neptunomonas antarctica TaxID=619304 RepID=A0A1N7JD97_9GAMM|nr:ABC transporter ATP-binding protein [Neptunomonas antarctica]SIS47246.1 ABC-type bacteriocin/lantibiotic exporter, contains an N-terminal double-glycine peptidase domain [Neptunomonas antarctica]